MTEATPCRRACADHLSILSHQSIAQRLRKVAAAIRSRLRLAAKQFAWRKRLRNFLAPIFLLISQSQIKRARVTCPFQSEVN